MIISLRNLSRLFHCSVVNVLCPFQRQLHKYITWELLCQGLFISFRNLHPSSSFGRLDNLTTVKLICQVLFVTFSKKLPEA